MSVFDRRALNPGVAPREVLAWAMYDFANSGYTTVVLTAVFNAYFVSVVAGNAPWATLAWTLALAAASALAMLTAPAIGAWADAHGTKKRALLASTAGCVLGTLALAWSQPGTVALAVVAVVVSNYFFSIGEGLIAAFLPELSRPASLGRVSGWGWSFGYFGGMLTLGLCLWIVLGAQADGRPATEFVPTTMLVTAAVFAIASIPTFALLRERAGGSGRGAEGSRGAPGGSGRGAEGNGSAPGGEDRGALARLARTWRESARFVDFRRLLVCGTLYQAGIAVVIALAAVYAEQVMGFRQTQTMALVFLVNVASAAGAFLFGYAEDRIGHKRGLAWTLVGWILMVTIVAAGESVAGFWLGATIAGLCMGASQSCGRAMVGAMAPEARRAEFYGLWTFAVRLAAIVGPVTYGLVTLATAGNHRISIAITGLFFVAGLLMLSRIDVARGIRAAAD